MATRIVFAVLAFAALVVPISAEAGQGAIVSGVVAATAIESRTEVSVTGAVAYQVNRFLGFGVEVTTVPVLKPDGASLRASTVSDSLGSAFVRDSLAPPMVSAVDGHATVFTTDVRLEIPTVAARFLPYVVVGGGVATIKDNFTVTAPMPIVGIPVMTEPQPVTQSSTSLALNVGGGASVLVVAHVSVDVDLRYVRLISSRDLNVRRFGVGVSYRF